MQLLLLIITAAGLGFSLYIAGVHVYIQINPFSKFYTHYYQKKYRIPFYIITLTLLLVGLSQPVYRHKEPFEKFKADVLQTAPELQYFFDNEPSIYGYSRAIGSDMMRFFYILIGIMVILVLSLTAFALNYVRMLKKAAESQFFSKSTLKMQVRFGAN
uniref:NADH dehydrogenase subunit 6 n=1 Tax=Panagrolaimus sp. JU765 TaxID=591449 RepID=A0AC34RP86_9BILA